MSASQPATSDASETYMFQAEINQLMSLIINAFYSNKEIFLRELIANASDAMDKYRHTALQNGGGVDEVNKLKIQIVANKDNRTLCIEDNGIGMTRTELIENLGTIARSGTKTFMQAMAENKDLSLIGQFGVGFYSAYLVADSVVVVSRGMDSDETYVWESAATGSFTVKVAPEEWKMERGTRLILKMKDDQTEMIEESKIREIVNKHSSFIAYPIELEATRTKEVEIEDDVTVEDEKKDGEETKAEAEAETKAGDADVEGVVEDAPVEGAEAEIVKAKKTRTESYKEWEHLNKQKPIWMRKPDEVEAEEYNAFYKAFCNDWEEPLARKHFTVEGGLEFRGLLYTPKRTPFEMFGRDKRNNLKLYVRRVFITDNSEDLIPEWLSFVKGLVDSDDLPLNVSREMLQQNNIMKVIKKNVVKKCVEMFTEMAVDKPDDFKVFYDNFSKNLKLGVYDDEKNKDKLVDLLRFHSSKSGEDRTSLDDYVTRMKEDQKTIYYIIGENMAQVKSSPFTEKLRKKGYEVLYMVDAIDEYMMQRLREYKDKKMVCVTKEGALLDDETEEEKKAREESFKETCEKMKEIINGTGEKVENVRVSGRITDTPAVLVTSEYGWSANMERIMKAQALQSNQMAGYMSSKKILEINGDHKLVRAIQKRLADPEESQKASTRDLINILYETAVINSGFTMEDPTVFVRRVHRLLEVGLNVDDEGEVEGEVDGEVDGEGKVGEGGEAGVEGKMEELD